MDAVESIDCRETLCRLVVDASRLGALQSVVKTSIGDGYSFKYHLDHENPDVAVAMLARDGPAADSE